MDELMQRLAAWSVAVNQRDIEAYAELVAEDVVWLPPAGNAIIGRDAFRKWLGPFFAAYEYEYTVSNTRWLNAGDWIAEHSAFESRVTPIAGGSTMSHLGTYVVIWRRDPDRLWRIDRYVDQSSLSDVRSS